jgi:hypothetical protein
MEFRLESDIEADHLIVAPLRQIDNFTPLRPATRDQDAR